MAGEKKGEKKEERLGGVHSLKAGPGSRSSRLEAEKNHSPDRFCERLTASDSADQIELLLTGFPGLAFSRQK